MARNDQTPEDFEKFAEELSKGAKTLKSIAANMRKNDLSTALVHGSTVRNIYVPSLLDWIEKTSADVNSQIRASLAGVKSNAELMKEQSDNQKRATGKKKPK